MAIGVYTSVMSLTIGFCMLIANFGTDIQEKLRQFNRILISSEDNEELSAEDRAILRKKLNEIIAFHAEARE